MEPLLLPLDKDKESDKKKDKSEDKKDADKVAEKKKEDIPKPGGAEPEKAEKSKSLIEPDLNEPAPPGEEPPVDLKAALSRNDKDDDKENTKKEESKRSRYSGVFAYNSHHMIICRLRCKGFVCSFSLNFQIL